MREKQTCCEQPTQRRRTLWGSEQRRCVRELFRMMGREDCNLRVIARTRDIKSVITVWRYKFNENITLTSFEARWQAGKCTISLCVHMIDPVLTLNFNWDCVKCLAISADTRDDQHLKWRLNEMLLGVLRENTWGMKMNTSACLYIWNKIFLKGTVHPKTKNLSSFTHPHVVNQPIWLSITCDTKKLNFVESIKINWWTTNQCKSIKSLLPKLIVVSRCWTDWGSMPWRPRRNHLKVTF